jgi:outer membrane protein TolC
MDTRRTTVPGTFRRRYLAWAILASLVITAAWAGSLVAGPSPTTPAAPPTFKAPVPAPCDKPLPINLAAALQLANARPLDVQIASERIQEAAAQLARARVLWLPTIYLGTDYYRHVGRIQETAGRVFDADRGAFMVGAGPTAVFALTDAIFEPLSARQVLRARAADLRAATNDSLLAVAEAYFDVQQARGQLAGAEDAVRQAEELARRVEKLAPSLVPPVEVVRARTEMARLRQAVVVAREHWHTSSAELARLLRLEPSALVEPLEPPQLRVTLVALDQPVDDLIPLALTNRPELAAQQALVQATLQRLRQERIRPLVPSVLLRGNSTNPSGTLAGGLYGGGHNESMDNFGARGDFDIQVLWELQNLGFGNAARVRERRAEHQLSVLELFRLQDRVAAEVAQSYAQAQSAAARVDEAAQEVQDAIESVNQNFEGLGQTRTTGNLIILIIRPQEVVAAIQALALSYNDYYGAVEDANRAQFRLYHALGHPAEWVAEHKLDCPLPPKPPSQP